jgi:hypothetical protein
MKKIIAGIIIPALILSFTGFTSCKNRSTEVKKDVEKEQVKTIENSIETNVYPLLKSSRCLLILKSVI